MFGFQKMEGRCLTLPKRQFLRGENTYQGGR